MGICFSCVAHKAEGRVRNVLTGAESDLPDEEIRICVSVHPRQLHHQPLKETNSEYAKTDQTAID
ncbi:MAG: hypothetical protein R2709_07810 [Marmoricola sp.]